MNLKSRLEELGFSEDEKDEIEKIIEVLKNNPMPSNAKNFNQQEIFTELDAVATTDLSTEFAVNENIRMF